MTDYEKTIKVSVVIYVKNTVNYIEQCIMSVRNQTLKEIEILVIDGGSTDGTKEIIEKAKEQDHRIRTFDAPSSVGAQFNLGLQKARGKYIGICEADDYIPSDMYECQYRIAEENCLDVLRAGYYQICSVNGREYRFEHMACGKKEWTDKVIENDGFFFLGEAVNGFWSGLYSRHFLRKHDIRMNETKGAAHQDLSFSFLTQMYAKRIWFMSESFYCYRIDNFNASAYSLQGVTLHMNEYKALKKQLVDRKMWEEYKNVFFSWELLSYRWLLRKLSREERKEEIKRIYKLLKKQAMEYGYSLEDVFDKMQELGESLEKDETDFSQKILEETEKNEEFLAYITASYRGDKRILLFGIGQIGNILKQFFELCEKEVVLLDNSGKLQNTGFMGQKVYEPGEAAKEFPNEKFVIASAVHGQEMKQQLLLAGIEEERILICDDEEFLLREIFAKAEAYGK